MYRSTWFRSVVSLLLIVALLSASVIAPRKAQAEPITLTSAAAVAVLIAAAGSYVAVDNLDGFDDVGNWTIERARAVNAYVQALYANAAASDQAQMLSAGVMDGYRGVQAVWGAITTHNAYAQVDSVVETGKYLLGKWWFDLSGFGNTVVAQSGDFITLPNGYYGVSSGLNPNHRQYLTQMAGVSDVYGLSDWGFTWANLIDGSFPTVNGVNLWLVGGVVQYAYFSIQCSHSTYSISLNPDGSARDTYSQNSLLHIKTHAKVSYGYTGTADTYVPQIAPSTQSAEGDQAPKKVTIPPIGWAFDKPSSPDNTVEDNTAAGEGVGADTEGFSISKAFSALYGGVKELGTSLVTALTGLWDLLNAGFTDVLQSMADLPANVGQAIDGFLSPVLDGISQGIDDLIVGVGTLAGSIGQSIDGFLSPVLDGIAQGIDDLIVGVGAIAGAVGQAIDNFIGETLDTIGAAVTATGAVLGQIWSWLSSTLSALLQGLLEGLQAIGVTLANVWTWCSTLVSSLVDSLVSGISAAFTPSILFDPVLEFMSDLEDFFFIFKGWA